MNEIVIAVFAFVAGGALAWFWRASLARAALSPIEQQLTEKASELDAYKAEHGRAAALLKAETERRATAEATLS